MKKFEKYCPFCNNLGPNINSYTCPCGARIFMLSHDDSDLYIMYNCDDYCIDASRQEMVVAYFGNVIARYPAIPFSGTYESYRELLISKIEKLKIFL